MPQAELILFLVASGFVMAALLGSGLAVFAGRNESFRISLNSPFVALAGFVYCMFAGPYLLVLNLLKYRKAGSISGLFLAFLCLLSVLWSFCSGILVLQLLALTGAVTV